MVFVSLKIYLISENISFWRQRTANLSYRWLNMDLRLLLTQNGEVGFNYNCSVAIFELCLLIQVFEITLILVNNHFGNKDYQDQRF